MPKKKYYQRNKEKYSQESKDYYQNNKDHPEIQWKRKKEKAENYQRNKAEILKEQKENRQTPFGKLKHSEDAKKHRIRNPIKVKARNMANKQLKYLKEPFKEFHHPDYSQPLLVEVLPIAEHRALHAQINSQIQLN